MSGRWVWRRDNVTIFEEAFAPIDDLEGGVGGDGVVGGVVKLEQMGKFFVDEGFDHLVEGPAAVDVTDAEVVRAAMGDRKEVAVFVDDEFAEEMREGCGRGAGPPFWVREMEAPVTDDVVTMEEVELDKEIR